MSGVIASKESEGKVGASGILRFTKEDIEDGVNPIQEMIGASGGQVCIAEIEATKDLVRDWLINQAYNRRPIERAIRQYVNDMNAGKWQLTHQGFAFNSDGQLIDGQNRSIAFLRSDMDVLNVLVTCNLKKTAQTDAIDMGAARTVAHRLSIWEGREVGRFEVSIANTAITFSLAETPFGKKNRLVASDLVDIYDKLGHRDAMEWTMKFYDSLGKLKGKSVAALWANIWRARENTKDADVQKLESFVLEGLGVRRPNDWAWRWNQLLFGARQKDAPDYIRSLIVGGRQHRQQFYLITNRLLKLHMDGAPFDESKKFKIAAKVENFMFKEESAPNPKKAKKDTK